MSFDKDRNLIGLTEHFVFIPFISTRKYNPKSRGSKPDIIQVAISSKLISIFLQFGKLYEAKLVAVVHILNLVPTKVE